MTEDNQLLGAVLQTRDSVSELDKRMGRMEESLDVIKFHQREQNGNVDRAIAWQTAHDDRIREDEIAIGAALQERARIVGHLQRVRNAIKEWPVPLVYAGGTLLMFTNVAVWIYWRIG